MRWVGLYHSAWVFPLPARMRTAEPCSPSAPNPTPCSSINYTAACSEMAAIPAALHAFHKAGVWGVGGPLATRQHPPLMVYGCDTADLALVFFFFLCTIFEALINALSGVKESDWDRRSARGWPNPKTAGSRCGSKWTTTGHLPPDCPAIRSHSMEAIHELQ